MKLLFLQAKKPQSRKKNSVATLHSPRIQLVHCKMPTRQLYNRRVQQQLLRSVVPPFQNRKKHCVLEHAQFLGSADFVCCKHCWGHFLLGSRSEAGHCGVLCQGSSSNGGRTAARKLKCAAHIPFLARLCDFLRRSNPFGHTIPHGLRWSTAVFDSLTPF